MTKTDQDRLRERTLRDLKDDDGSHLYSPNWAPGLTCLTEALQRNAANIVAQFYEELARLPKSKSILDTLSGAEFQHLKSQQIQNLFKLAAPNLTAADHRAMALRLGRIHAMVGLDREELVRSRGILAAAIHNNLDVTVHGEALSLLGRRRNRDLAYQEEAYQSLQRTRQDVLLRITRLASEVSSYTDLIDRVVEILGQHDEVAACSVGRPDDQGVFQFEAVSGKSIAKYLANLESSAEQHITTDDDRPQGQGPTGRAWRSGRVERIINFQTDPQAVPWKVFALREGFRSCATIPLSQPGSPPMAILSLYSAFPGGYAGADQLAFIELLQTLLGSAIARIENLQGRTATVPLAIREHWTTLLRSDALQMHYQPLLDLKTGQITKVEALARLRVAGQFLAPAEFFPALSSSDFLELYVRGLGQALSERNLWLQSGINVNVSVNLPPSALSDIRYFEATQRALIEHDCAPNVLTLEILETDALPPGIDVSWELAKFKMLGISLAEDDLGSGHSSLNRLRELPFDWIKIDRSIVSLVGQDASDVLKFIYQLTRLGHSLGKSVIVEGVESAELLEAILILGVDVAQGWAIARPMQTQQLMAWMGSQPGVPDPHNPQSALGKLAKLLIWEERLHLISGDTLASDRLAEIIAMPAHATAIALVTRPHPDSSCQVCAFSKFFMEMWSSLPIGSLDSTHALIDLLVRYGPRSAAYRSARQQLVTSTMFSPARF